MAECFVTMSLESKIKDEETLSFILEILRELKENKEINYDHVKERFN
jgi:hypothetical protein